MHLLLMILIPILWIAYAILEGRREGYLYNYRDNKDLEYKTDLHLAYAIQRGVFGAALGLSLITIAPWYLAILALSGLALTFPLFHDGYYYVTRNKIDSSLYKKKFKTNKNTSTAKISIQKYKTRLALAIAGFLAYGGYIVWVYLTP